jgi:hypothetical protein
MIETEPYSPLHYLKRHDAPFFFGHGLLEICKGQVRHGWRLLKLAVACLALSACAPHVRYVSIYCITPPQLQKLKDAEPPKVGNQLTGQAQDDFKIIAGNDVELRQYSGDLLNVLGNCTEPPASSR